MTFDLSNTPYIVFVEDYAHNNNIVVMKYDGIEWKPVGSSEINRKSGSASIVVDSHGTPYVAYIDVSRHNHPVPAVIKYTSDSGWMTVGKTELNSKVVYDDHNIDIVLDSNDTPYIAFNNVNPAVGGEVMKFTSGKWTSLGTLPRDEAYGIRLRIDKSNIPYICYRDGGSESKATVMKYILDQGWTSVGKRKFSNGMMAHGLSFAIDNSGTPYIAYGITDHPVYGTVVMKYQNSE